MQYAASEYTDSLHAVGVQISMAEVGAAWQNGYAERLMRTIKEEEVDLSEMRIIMMPCNSWVDSSMRSI